MVKLPKEATHYRPCQYRAQCCGDCRHFLRRPGSAVGACRIVRGSIRQDMTCDCFAPKAER